MVKLNTHHLPALNPLELEAFLARIDQTNLSPKGKAMIRRMFQAAANKNAEDAPTVIMTLPKVRRADVEQTTIDVDSFLSGMARRGAERLSAMSDAEWNALVEEANAE